MDKQLLERGKILGRRYEILDFLGRGGFGETYLAIDKLKMNSSCVIKRLKPSKTEPDILIAARKLFDREAEFLYKLGHHDQIPHLLAHFEENEEEKGFYLAQEFIDGKDLKKELESVKQLSEAQAIELLYDVLNILKFVHQHKVIHRDIKPSNLIRRHSDGKIVLIDFGAVKQISSQETTSDGLTASTIAIGTPGYMPNEQQGGKPRHSSDIYALGMTAIHALIGKLPSELEEDRFTGEIIWRKYVPTVDNRLAAILDKMIKSHFRDRYKDADEVLKDLRKLRNSWEDRVSSVISNVSTIANRRLPLLRLAGVKYVLLALVAIGAVFTIPKLYSLIPISPSPSAEQLLEKAWELYNSEDYKAAITTIDKYLKIKPDAPYAWNGKGNALDKLKRYDEAIVAYDKALKLKKDDVVIWTNKIDTFINSESYDQAIETSQEALKLFPNNSQVWAYQGVALFNLEKYSEALKSLDKALELDLNNVRAWGYTGDTLFQFKRYDEAIKAYTEALNREPRDILLWFNKSAAEYQAKRFNDAFYSLEEVIRINPDLPKAWFGKGQVLYELKRYSEAVKAYDKALELQPDYPDAKEAREQAAKQL